METKREIVQKLYDGFKVNKKTVRLIVNATLQGVEVPHQLRSTPNLTLDLKPGNHRNFALDDSKLQVTLGFFGHPHHCIVPWEAVWGYATEETKGVFADSVPKEFEQPTGALAVKVKAS